MRTPPAVHLPRSSQERVWGRWLLCGNGLHVLCACKTEEEEAQESSADVSEGRAAIVVSGCGGREEVVGTALIWWKLSLGVRMQTVTVSPPRVRKRVLGVRP